MIKFLDWIKKFIQGTANNIMWWTNISLWAALLGAIGVTAWYALDESGKNFIDKLYESENKNKK